MVRVRSSTVRSRRHYRALDLGFVPPPSGAGWNRPYVAPPSGFFDEESSNFCHVGLGTLDIPPSGFHDDDEMSHLYDTGFSVGRFPVPPPPWRHRGIYPCNAPCSGLWADMEDSDEEVLQLDAALQPVLEDAPL